jgi:hypothetical protein
MTTARDLQAQNFEETLQSKQDVWAGGDATVRRALLTELAQSLSRSGKPTEHMKKVRRYHLPVQKILN